MKHLLLILILLGSSLSVAQAQPMESLCGKACGDCSAGTWTCDGGTTTCVMPDSTSALSDIIVNGMPAADTGTRAVFDPDDYAGTDAQKFQLASAAAAVSDGAVVMDRIYETTSMVNVYENVMYTGGGIRRACTGVGTVTTFDTNCMQLTGDTFAPGTLVLVARDETYAGHIGSITVSTSTAGEVCSSAALGFTPVAGDTLIAAHHLVRGSDTYIDGVIIDSVLFDGNSACNSYNHDWRENNSLLLRGANTIRNSVFLNSPSEAITTCGAVVADNIASNLSGSFIHKSCSAVSEPFDIVARNYIHNVNIEGDTVMQHSEGALTLSANAGRIMSVGNSFIDGNEGVFGYGNEDDEDSSGIYDCYTRFPHIIELYGTANPATFDFRTSNLIDVPLTIVGP